MSQKQLGDALGLSSQQVQKYEMGTNRVGSGRLQEISDILGVPIPYFFDDRGSGRSSKKRSPMAKEIEQFLFQKDSLDLVIAYNAISNPDVRQALIGMAIAIAKAASA